MVMERRGAALRQKSKGQKLQRQAEQGEPERRELIELQKQLDVLNQMLQAQFQAWYELPTRLMELIWAPVNPARGRSTSSKERVEISPDEARWSAAIDEVLEQLAEDAAAERIAMEELLDRVSTPGDIEAGATGATAR